MATQKTSTKAKTKTAKSKKASAASAKRLSVKTKAVSARAKATAKVYDFRRWHMISLGVFVVLSVLVVLFMNHASFQLFVSHLTQDSLTHTMVPAVHHIYDIQVRWLVLATLVVSMIVPFLYLTKYQKRYTLDLQNKMLPLRWIDLGLSGLLMLETVALVSGVSDVITLKLVGIVAIGLALMAWLDERAATKTSFTSLNILKLLLVFILAMPIVSTSLYGMVRAPWYVYALFSGVVVMLLVNTVNHQRLRAGQSYVTTERNYVVSNLISKTAFALILIFGFMK